MFTKYVQRTLIVAASLIVAFAILFVSIFRSAAVKFDSSGLETKTPQAVLGNANTVIDYPLVYPGRILPDSPLWPLKALRDRIWLLITTNPMRKAELQLLFADKRLGSSRELFLKDKVGDGYSTLTKAEKYLEEAALSEKQNRDKGMNTTELLERLAKASLKHAEIIQEITDTAPEDLKPGIIHLEDYPKKVFEDARNALLEKGKNPPECPFTWC